MALTTPPSLLATAFILAVSSQALRADDPVWHNHSAKDITLKVVADSKNEGIMTFTPGGTFKTTGDIITWKAGQKMTVKYSSLPKYAHFKFQVIDSTGRWATFVADNPSFGSPTVKLQEGEHSPQTNPPKDDGRQSLYDTGRSKGGLQISNTFMTWPYPVKWN